MAWALGSRLAAPSLKGTTAVCGPSLTTGPAPPSHSRSRAWGRLIPRCPRRRLVRGGTLCQGASMSPENVVVARSLVSIVDDDESVRESLPGLIRQFGLDA